MDFWALRLPLLEQPQGRRTCCAEKMHFRTGRVMKSSFEKKKTQTHNQALDEIQPARMTKSHKAEQRHSPESFLA